MARGKRKTAETAETAKPRGLRRRSNGQFAVGNRGGTGRPRTLEPEREPDPWDILDLEEPDLSFITRRNLAILSEAGVDPEKLRRVMGQ